MTETPLHVQIIEHLERRVTVRREQHRAKAGDGLPDQEYQRMVGRIREATALLEELATLKRSSLEDFDDEEEDSEQKPARRNRRAR